MYFYYQSFLSRLLIIPDRDKETNIYYHRKKKRSIFKFLPSHSWHSFNFTKIKLWWFPVVVYFFCLIFFSRDLILHLLFKSVWKTKNGNYKGQKPLISFFLERWLEEKKYNKPHVMDYVVIIFTFICELFIWFFI